jgi:hypothetical protein
MIHKKIPILSYALVYFIGIVVILNFNSDPNYSFLSNTTSELGAQLTVNSQWMNLSFILLGLSIFIDLWVSKNMALAVKVIGSVFSFFLWMTAMFGHRPIDSSLSYNLLFDQLHSVFATLTGISFACLQTMIFATEKSKSIKILSIILFMISIVIPILMFQLELIKGLLQKLMMLISFLGLICYFIYKKRR